MYEERSNELVNVLKNKNALNANPAPSPLLQPQIQQVRALSHQFRQHLKALRRQPILRQVELLNDKGIQLGEDRHACLFLKDPVV